MNVGSTVEAALSAFDQKRLQINEVLVRYSHIIPLAAVSCCFLIATTVSIVRYASAG